MKIAVVGASCTGKTTIARALGDALGVSVLANPTEQVLQSSGYHTLFEWGAATEGWSALVEKQAARECGLERGIVDHGAIDLFCFIQRWAWNRMSPERVEALRDLVRDAAASYDAVVVTAPALVAPPAPWRFRNTLAIAQDHRLTLGLLSELHLSARSLILEPMSVEDTIETALRHCGSGPEGTIR